MFDVVDDVITLENGFGRDVSERDVQQNAAGGALREAVNMRSRAGRSQGYEGGSPQDRICAPRQIDLDLGDQLNEFLLEALGSHRVEVKSYNLSDRRPEAQQEAC